MAFVQSATRTSARRRRRRLLDLLPAASDRSSELSSFLDIYIYIYIPSSS